MVVFECYSLEVTYIALSHTLSGGSSEIFPRMTKIFHPTVTISEDTTCSPYPGYTEANCTTATGPSNHPPKMLK